MMTFTKQDIKRLQWSIALLLALVIVGAVIVSIATKAYNNAKLSNTQAAAVREEARGKSARATQEEQELREKITIYQSMVARGIIGQEHRIDWIETIRKIKQARKLIDVRYEIGPQEPVKPDVVTSAIGSFDIMASPMKLDMLLLHENDLLGFLADLRAQVQGYLRVRRCDVSRAMVAAPERGPMPQLQAHCEIDWITVRERQ